MTDVEAQADQIRADYASTFQTDAGRRVLAHLVSICHVYGPCHVPGDPHTSAFQEGQRDTALAILNSLTPLSDEERSAVADNEEKRREFEDTYDVRYPG